MADNKARMCVGLLAHVDAGKTTLAEALLYTGGALRNLGRVDHGNAFLDTFSLERARGITIFSKQALLQLPDLQITLLDTPGHVDFSAEMERTLEVLDAAVLVIGGGAGVQSHTLTLWKLLRQRNIPTFLFVSKMDLPGADRESIRQDLRRSLSESIIDMELRDPEELALCDEGLLEEVLETGSVCDHSLRDAVGRCAVFPLYFGAALKLQGVETLMAGLEKFGPRSPAGAEFSARVFKISRDAQGVRETHMKITGGSLKPRQAVDGEKITQLRRYSGAKFQSLEEAFPGDVVAAVGLSKPAAGTGLGAASQAFSASLTPVLTYRLIPPAGYDLTLALSQLRQLEEEDPQLHVQFDEAHQELRVQLMGPIQMEILTDLLKTRYGMEATFGQGSILYRETIGTTVEGVGHYEPLRHYAEVHLILEPGPRGSGIMLDSVCSENDLDRNWQRLILTHLAEKTHVGVLTGSPITDIKISLAAGRAHLKHTEGGDFRQATYRALRQGLMQAESILLEPWYDFRLTVPQANVGRAMTDLQNMGAELLPMEMTEAGAVFTGSAPVSELGEYARELSAYTHGLGLISYSFRGYAPCRNQQQVVQQLGYDPEADLPNTPDSVFCAHGAGFTVKWDQVPQYMNLPSVLRPPEPEESEREVLGRRYKALAATDKELLQIFERTYGPVKTRLPEPMRRAPASDSAVKQKKAPPVPAGPEYVLVDGYNIIFAWEDLKALAGQDLAAARDRLIDILRNYQSYRQHPVILVFDAYKVPGGTGSVEHYGDLSVVYTKEAQTADMYIEKLSYELGKKHRVRVATSDGLEQIIILGHGCLRVPARIFRDEVDQVMAEIRRCLSGEV